MFKYNYSKIGERFRSERKKLGISQQELIDRIREKEKPTVGRNILSRLENGDETAFNGISIAQLTAICEEFDCSISYLLGEYEARSYDLEFICQKTGLTEASIKKIYSQKNDFLNTFIESDYYYDIDYNYDQLSNSFLRLCSFATFLNNIEAQAKSVNKNSSSYQKLNEQFSDALSASERLELQVNYNIYQMGILFGEIWRKYKQDKTNIIHQQLPENYL